MKALIGAVTVLAALGVAPGIQQWLSQVLYLSLSLEQTAHWPGRAQPLAARIMIPECLNVPRTQHIARMVVGGHSAQERSRSLMCCESPLVKLTADV